MPITLQIKKVVASAIRVAISYEKLTNRKLGITGEVGEVLVCSHKKLKEKGLKLSSNPILAGYDAIDKNGKQYQIKAKQSDRGSLSRFSNHKFDVVIVAVFDTNYKIKELWRASYKKLEPLIAGHKRRNPSLPEFKRVAKEIL